MRGRGFIVVDPCSRAGNRGATSSPGRRQTTAGPGPGRLRRGRGEGRGFTIVETLVASLLLLLGALALAQACSCARAWQGVALHRAQASSLAAQEMEDLVRQGYGAVPLGSQPPQTVFLEGGGSCPCQLYVTVTQEIFADSNGLKRVTVEARWTEPHLPGEPTQSLQLVTYLARTTVP